MLIATYGQLIDSSRIFGAPLGYNYHNIRGWVIVLSPTLPPPPDALTAFAESAVVETARPSKKDGDMSRHWSGVEPGHYFDDCHRLRHLALSTYSESSVSVPFYRSEPEGLSHLLARGVGVPGQVSPWRLRVSHNKSHQG